MSYKIAVASSDGRLVDQTFGAAKAFLIYEVADGAYKRLEERVFREEVTDKNGQAPPAGCNPPAGCGDGKAGGDSSEAEGSRGKTESSGASDAGSNYGSEGSGCGSQAGDSCGSDAGSRCGKGGCGGAGEASKKVELVADCRCVVCKKIGFQIQKQLERKAISSFDVDCSVEEALNRISFYYGRMDKHESLRRRS